MKTKTILIAAGVIGGLIGLGVLVNYYLSDEDKAPEPKLRDPQPEKKKTVPPPTQPIAKPVAVKDELAFEPEQKISAPMNQESKPVEDASPALLLHEEEHAEIPVPEVKSSFPAPTADEFPLRLGSKGPRVERLQVFMLRNYGFIGKITGVFDEPTEAQLKKRLHTATLDEKTYQRYRMGKHVHEQVIIR